MTIRSNWIRAIIINLIILILVCIFTDMTYETNDDYAIAARIAAGDPFAYYVNYYLCVPLVALQKMVSFVNVYMLLQVVSSWAAFVFITKVFLDSDKGVLFQIPFVLIIAVFSFDHYSILQFTKTAGLLAVAGTLLLVDGAVNRRGAPRYFWGLLFMYLAAAFRVKSMVFAIGFAGLFLIFWLIENRKRLRPEGYLSPGRLAGCLVVLILLAGTLGFNLASESVNNGTEELKAYHEYNTYRSYVVDYSVYDYFKDHPELYNEVDISKDDLYLIDHWYFDYDGAASTENLKAVREVYDKNSTGENRSVQSLVKKFIRDCISRIRKLTASGIQLLILIVAAAVMLLRLKPKAMVYVLAVGVCAAGCYLMLYYMGRPAYRAIYLINVAAAFWLLYWFDRSRIRGSEKQKEKKSRALGVLSAACCVVLCAALAGGLYLEYGRCADSHSEIEGRLRPAELEKRIAEDQDHVYVFSTREKRNLKSYAEPLMVPEADANVLTFGGWGTGSPYLMRKTRALGLENVFEDIIDNDKVYVIEDRNVKRMEEYLTRWYGEKGDQGKISYVLDSEVDGYSIWKVVRSR